MALSSPGVAGVTGVAAAEEGEVSEGLGLAARTASDASAADASRGGSKLNPARTRSSSDPDDDDEDDDATASAIRSFASFFMSATGK